MLHLCVWCPPNVEQLSNTWMMALCRSSWCHGAPTAVFLSPAPRGTRFFQSYPAQTRRSLSGFCTTTNKNFSIYWAAMNWNIAIPYMEVISVLNTAIVVVFIHSIKLCKILTFLLKCLTISWLIFYMYIIFHKSYIERGVINIFII